MELRITGNITVGTLNTTAGSIRLYNGTTTSASVTLGDQNLSYRRSNTEIQLKKNAE